MQLATKCVLHTPKLVSIRSESLCIPLSLALLGSRLDDMQLTHSHMFWEVCHLQATR